MTDLRKLPVDLSALDDPASLGADVAAGRVRLDWSRVTEAPIAILVQLLEHLAPDTEGVGLDTIPPALRPEIDEELENAAKRRSRRSARTSVAEDSPEYETTPPDDPGGDETPDVDRRWLREELWRLALSDLLGPANGPHEVLVHQSDSPEERYILGALAPARTADPSASHTSPSSQDEAIESGQQALLDAQSDEELDSIVSASAAEEGAIDPGGKSAWGMRPNSLGLTFQVDRTVPSIRVRAQWGKYRRIAADQVDTEQDIPELSKRVWQREPHDTGWIEIPLQTERSQRELFDSDAEGGIALKWRTRAHGESDPWLVTLFLANERPEPKKLKAEAWLFQAELTVEGSDDRPVFLARSRRPIQGMDMEDASLEMLYRKQVEFAVGHGVAVEAEGTSSGRALRLRTVAAPTFEVAQVTAPTPDDIPELGGLVVDMRELASLPQNEITAALKPLTLAYRAWIDRREASLQDDTTLADHQAAASESIASARRSLERIDAGIDLIASDANAFRAFQFMQQAMADQRVHTELVWRRRRGESGSLEDVDLPEFRSWRPFQLAFILLSVPSLTLLHHQDRSVSQDAIADLLWFPTGGGKTEAYLGLTAYTLAIRRLQGVIAGHSGDYGVAVLMRYTLRLLTLQQFQRAAALICACEVLRRANPTLWGVEPFRLGLWVGRAATPNTTAQSKEALDKGAASGVGTPAQLTDCPWCGSPIDSRHNIRVEETPGRTLIFCGDADRSCPFGRMASPDEGLPVVVVDEEVYRLLPSLVIATVDKFAQMPWRGAVANLFGRVNRRCPRHGFWAADIDDTDSHRAHGRWPATGTVPVLPARPIDLIIQDELHLISGPLGSLVGLYETAIDGLLEWEVDGQAVRPKLIASTATIRRATYQVTALYVRNVEIFPPPGIDVTDSFFARTADLETKPGRLYAGVCVPGMRHKAVLIRVYVALLGAAEKLRKEFGSAATDPYMTMLGYFSSIRELGSMRRAVEDDVQRRLLQMQRYRDWPNRTIERVEELTSRISSSDIPIRLSELERVFVDERRKNDPRPLDVVLATNMISVGVDVPRLGLMVVAGQPKVTAEYIQATSRVGRRDPGLVVTVFHGNRPRDLSHYERFQHDHATFYRQVEPLSVTPFSAGSIDRGLAGVLVSLIRLGDSSLTGNEHAGELTRETKEAREALARISNRCAAVNSDQVLGKYVEAALQNKLDEWIHRAESTSGAVLGYRTARDGKTVGLLKEPEPGNWSTFTCAMSLRNVEATVPLILKDTSGK